MGFWSDGKEVYVPCVLALALVVRRLIVGAIVAADPGPTIAEVERMADGLLAITSSPSRDASPLTPFDNAGVGGIVFFDDEDVGRCPPDVAGR